MQGVFWLSAACLAVPVVYHTERAEVIGPQVSQQSTLVCFHVHGCQSAPTVPCVEALASGTAQHNKHFKLSPEDADSAPRCRCAQQVVLSEGVASLSVARELGSGGKVQLLAFCLFEVLIGE